VPVSDPILSISRCEQKGWLCMRSIWFVVVLTLLIPDAAIAQEKGQVGLTMGYPPSVGIVWHVADRMALRPEVSFNRDTTDSILTETFDNQTQTIRFSSTATFVGSGVSGLFYLRKRDALSAFLSPRYAYSHRSTTPVFTTAVTFSGDTTTTHELSGSFGAQYAMGPRFSVFGEVGAAYSASTSASDLVTPSIPSRSELTSHGVGMRSGVGVVVYFH